MTFLNRRLFDNVSVFVDSLSGANRVAFDVAKPNGVLTLGISGNVSANNIKVGTGSPEGSVAGIKGDIYQRTDGSVGTSLYIKESGSGSTGWSALGAPSSGSLSGGISGYSAFWSSSNSISASNAIIEADALLIVPQNQKDVFIGSNSKFHAATGVFTIGTTASTINDALEVNGTTRSKRFYSSVSANGFTNPQIYVDNTNSSTALEVRAMGNGNGGVPGWEQAVVLEASTGGASGGLVFGAYSGDILFQTNARNNVMRLTGSTERLILGGTNANDDGKHRLQIYGSIISKETGTVPTTADTGIILWTGAGNAPHIAMIKKDNTVNNKVWDQRVDSNKLSFRALRDDYTFPNEWMIANRGAAIVTNVSIPSASLTVGTTAWNGVDSVQTSGSLTSSNIKRGTGSPEGVVTGVVGDIFQRTDGAAGITLYIKESGSGNTGWTAVTPGSSSGSSLSGGVAGRAAIWSGTNSISASNRITENSSGVVLSGETVTDYLDLTNGAGNYGWQIGSANDGFYNGDLGFYERQAGTRRLIIKRDTGNILVGTSTDTSGAKLQVNGLISSSSLSSTRVPFTTGGALNDSQSFRFVPGAGAGLFVGDGTGGRYVVIDGAAGQERGFLLRSGGSNRWQALASTTSEAGANAGSNFQLAAYGDAGATIDVPLTINRAASGAVTFARPVVISSAAGLNPFTTSGEIMNAATTGSKISWSNSGNYYNWIESGGVAGNNYMRFACGNTEFMRLRSSGNLLIGTTADDGSNKLQVSGNIYASGSINVGSISTTANAGMNIYGAGQGGNRLTVNLASSGSPVINAGLLTGYDYQVTGAMNATQCGFRWSHAPSSFNTNLQAYVYNGGAGVFDAQQWTPTNVLIRVNDVDKVNVTSSALSANVNITSSNIQRGSGSPEGSVVGNVGDIYQRTDGSAGITLYIKESGTGNTGWTAVAPGSSGGSSLSGGIANRLAVWSSTSSISAASVISVGSSAVLIGTTTDNLSGTLQVVGDVHAAGVLRLNPGNVSGVAEAIRITSNPGTLDSGRSIEWREQDNNPPIAKIAGRRDSAGAGGGIAFHTALLVGDASREVARFNRYGALVIGTTGDDNGTDKLRVAGSAGISGNMVSNNWKRGTGSPEGVVSGTVGDVYQQIDGGIGSTLYVKENQPSATTGWTALSAPSTGLVNGNGSGVRDRLAVWGGTTTMSAANIAEIYTAPVAGGSESGLKIFNDNTRTSSAIWKTGPDFAHKWSNSSNTAIVTFTTGGRVLVGSGATDVGGATNLLQVAGNIMTTSTNGSISVGTASASSQGSMVVYGGNAAGGGHYRKYDSGLGGSVIDTPIVSGYDINLDGAGNFTRCGLRWSHETGSYTTQLKLYTNSTTNASSLVDSMILTPLRQSILANNVVRFNVDQTAISGNITFYAGGGSPSNLTTSAMTVKNQSLVVFRDLTESTTNAGYIGMDSSDNFRIGIKAADVITINTTGYVNVSNRLGVGPNFDNNVDELQVAGSAIVSDAIRVGTMLVFTTGGNYSVTTPPSGALYFDNVLSTFRAAPYPFESGINSVPLVRCVNIGSMIINNNNARQVLTTCNDSLSGSGTAEGLWGYPITPYQFWAPGKKIRIISEGSIQNTATPTLRIRLGISASKTTDDYLIMDSGAVTMSTITGVRDYNANYTVTCRSITSTGANLRVAGRFIYGITSNTFANINVGQANDITVPRDANWFLNLSAQFSAASTSNGITANYLEMSQVM